MKYWIIIILLLSVSTAKSQSENSFDTDLLQSEMNFYSSKTDSESFEILFHKSQLWKKKSNYEQSLLELRRAEKYAILAQEFTRLKFEKMLAYFLSADYNLANGIIMDSMELVTIKKGNEYGMMRAISYNELGEWEACKLELLKQNRGEDTSIINELKRLPTSCKYRSPDDCSRLSGWIPGAGQMKAGYPLKGLTSFGIQAGLLGFTAICYVSQFYITGTVFGILPLLKFHGGGMRLSAKLADRHNQADIWKLKSQYSSIIEKVYFIH